MTVHDEIQVTTAPLSQWARAKAVKTGWEILHRIRDYRGDLTSLRIPDPFTGQPSAEWHPLGTDPGDLGMALVYSAADELCPDDGWDRLAFDHARRLVEYYTHAVGLGIGLFGGTASVAYALRALSRGGERYRRALHDVEATLITRIEDKLAALPPSGGLASADYDVISGLAGAGMYLFASGDADERRRNAADRIVEHFCRLAVAPPPLGLWTPPRKITEVERNRSPHLHGGYLNLGFAHGISGVASLLGTAAARGSTSPALTSAVTAIGELITACLVDTAYGPDLPYFKLPADRQRGQQGLARSAWCYGNLGGAVALAHCASVDTRFLDTAISLLESVERRPVELRHVDNPSLCHGIAGQITVQRHVAAVAAVHGQPWSGPRQATLEQLLDMADAGAVFGLRNDNVPGAQTDSPGFLTGSGGAAVALISLGGDRITTAEAMLCGGAAC
ncbi:lanthionine synthetase C family protein [Streptomyces sp. DSM 41527]|uniref:Lanthionine synthetase C family protein n=1 Tax=Streptomyces mooreae TaxID=3075523 RepID=A0ABU2TFN8_9ACTN|nr:lanthionine synthetase C family protein [Streptomyces sp. DSM 41527]MDT0459735.1 lanthionine synthetase C family protein [Streptomyces sp. DSM 41527]